LSSVFPIVCSLSRSSPLSLAGPCTCHLLSLLLLSLLSSLSLLPWCWSSLVLSSSCLLSPGPDVILSSGGCPYGPLWPLLWFRLPSTVVVCIGIIILVILVLSAVGVGAFVIGVTWPCSLHFIAVVVLSGLGHWWCVSLCHPTVVAVVLPVLRGGGVVSGRWWCWGVLCAYLVGTWLPGPPGTSLGSLNLNQPPSHPIWMGRRA